MMFVLLEILKPTPGHHVDFKAIDITAQRQMSLILIPNRN